MFPAFAICEVAARIVRTERFGSAKPFFPIARFTYREDEQAKGSLWEMEYESYQ
jgi:hypothetical protein